MLHSFINYLNNQYHVEPNYSVTFIVTIFVLFLGEFIKWVGNKIRAFRQKQVYRKSQVLILQDLAKSCAKQSRTVSKSLKNASFLMGKDFKVNYNPIG